MEEEYNQLRSLFGSSRGAIKFHSLIFVYWMKLVSENCCKMFNTINSAVGSDDANQQLSPGSFNFFPLASFDIFQNFTALH